MCAQVNISNLEGTKLVEIKRPEDAGVHIRRDVECTIEAFIPAGEITGGKVRTRPLTQFKEGAVMFICCKCTHHWWVQFSVNAKNVDEDAAIHFLVEKDQDGIKISINHQESEITEQRISQSPTNDNEITQKSGVILHY